MISIENYSRLPERILNILLGQEVAYYKISRKFYMFFFVFHKVTERDYRDV